MNNHTLAQLEFSQPITAPVESVTDVTGLERLLSVSLGFLTIVGGILFVTWIVIAAYNWITAEGKPDKVEKARNHLVQAIIGLIILVGAYAIAGLISTILGFDIFNLADTLSTF